MNPVLKDLDKQIGRQVKEPRYAIKWGKAYYGSVVHGWCIELVAYDVSVNIVFLNGDRLAAPPVLGDGTRYLKLKSREELESSQLQEWIKQSCSMSGWAWLAVDLRVAPSSYLRYLRSLQRIASAPSPTLRRGQPAFPRSSKNISVLKRDRASGRIDVQLSAAGGTRN